MPELIYDTGYMKVTTRIAFVSVIVFGVLYLSFKRRKNSHAVVRLHVYYDGENGLYLAFDL